jgi:hypothetical protein
MKTLTTKELSERWKMAIGSIENWRQQKKGPRFMKMGGARNADVRYRLEDVEAFEKKHLQK